MFKKLDRPGLSRRPADSTNSSQHSNTSEGTQSTNKIPKVLNLSKTTLTRSQISLLCKGPKFCPSTHGNFIDIKADSRDFSRKLKLREKFWDTEFENESLVKHPSSYNPKCENPELSKILSTIERIDPLQQRSEDNLTKTERVALSELKDLSKTDIIIKKADKGNTLVIMDIPFYRDKMVLGDHLNTDTYQTADPNSDSNVMKNLKVLVDKHRSCLTSKEYDYITKYEWSTSNFYVLPKIHKCKDIIDKVQSCNSDYLKMDTPHDLKGRPIVGGPKSPTQHLSEFLEKVLSPLVPYQKSYVKDDWDFLRKFPPELDPSYKLYSCDIVSLYTSITHDLGLKALKYWIGKLRHLIPSRVKTEFILEAAEFVLTNNYFLFNDVMYLQLIGTAMGTIFAPPYSCLTIGYLEITKLYPELRMQFSLSIANFVEEQYKRYMDDGITPLPIDIDPKLFLEILNSLDSTIKFTLEEANVSILPNGSHCQTLSFLDISVILHSSGKVETDVFYKSTNNHDYLSYDSHHPQHVKDNIPYNLAKRIIVFCSNPDVEATRLQELRNWLITCKYPVALIDKKIKNAKLQGPAPEPNKKDSISYVTTHYDNYDVRNISTTSVSLLHNSHNSRINDVFKDCKIVTAFRQPPNLLRRLTSSKFSSSQMVNFENEPGLYTCKSNRCKLCREGYIIDCKQFQTANGQTWEIRCHITCNSYNVIYYLVCNFCKITSYCGKTNNLRLRMNNHKSSCLSGTSSDIFDNHVYHCKNNKDQIGPLFQIYAFMALKEERQLLSYESLFHNRSVDTMNSPQTR